MLVVAQVHNVSPIQALVQVPQAAKVTKIVARDWSAKVANVLPSQAAPKTVTVAQMPSVSQASVSPTVVVPMVKPNPANAQAEALESKRAQAEPGVPANVQPLPLVRPDRREAVSALMANKAVKRVMLTAKAGANVPVQVVQPLARRVPPEDVSAQMAKKAAKRVMPMAKAGVNALAQAVETIARRAKPNLANVRMVKMAPKPVVLMAKAGLSAHVAEAPRVVHPMPHKNASAASEKKVSKLAMPMAKAGPSANARRVPLDRNNFANVPTIPMASNFVQQVAKVGTHVIVPVAQEVPQMVALPMEERQTAVTTPINLAQTVFSAPQVTYAPTVHATSAHPQVAVAAHPIKHKAFYLSSLCSLSCASSLSSEDETTPKNNTFQ